MDQLASRQRRRVVLHTFRRFMLAAVLVAPFTVGAGNVSIQDANGVVREGGNIEDAFSEVLSGETLRISGRHVINPVLGGYGLFAPLQLRGVTNVTIVGTAGATIYGEGNGDFLTLENCADVEISGVTFQGVNPPGNQFGDQLFTMIMLRGTNRGVTIRGCRFLDFANHGVSHLWNAKTSEDVSVIDCLFENGGAQNVPGLGNDGAAISGIGSHWLIQGNRVRNCLRGFEVENGAPTTVQNVKIVDNTLIGVKDIGVMLFATNYDGDRFADILIARNTFQDFRYMAAGATAIFLTGGRSIQVHQNTLRGIGRQGMSLPAAFGVLRDVNITGNTIDDVGNNGIVMTAHPNRIAGVRIEGNLISRCNEAGIRLVDVGDAHVHANLCRDNGRHTVAGGIEVYGAASSNALISLNRCYNTFDPMGQDYGIRIGTGVAGAVVYDNDASDSRAAIRGVLDEGTNTRFGSPAGALSMPRMVVVALVQAPRMASILAGQDGSVELQWDAVIGRRYRIEFTNDPRDEEWEVLYDEIDADRSPMTAVDALGGAAVRYYRIVETD